MSALVRSKILGPFVNTLTAEYKYSRRNMQTFTQQVQTPFSFFKKNFFWIFYCVSEIYMKWRTFSKKGESSSLSISEIIDSKIGGYLCAWKALPQKQLSVINLLIFPWIWDKLSWKRSALVRSKILGLFVNTLTAEYTYSRRNMQTFTQQVQTPLSLKQKNCVSFSVFQLNFLLRFWNLHEMENIFKKKDESSSLSISEIIDVCLSPIRRWLPSTSILVAICRLSRNKFRRHFLFKKKTFSEFFNAFLKSTWNGEHFTSEQLLKSVRTAFGYQPVNG